MLSAYIWIQIAIGLIGMQSEIRIILQGHLRKDRAISLWALAVNTALVAWGIWLLVEVYRHA